MLELGFGGHGRSYRHGGFQPTEKRFYCQRVVGGAEYHVARYTVVRKNAIPADRNLRIHVERRARNHDIKASQEGAGKTRTR